MQGDRAFRKCTAGNEQLVHQGVRGSRGFWSSLGLAEGGVHVFRHGSRAGCCGQVLMVRECSRTEGGSWCPARPQPAPAVATWLLGQHGATYKCARQGGWEQMGGHLHAVNLPDEGPAPRISL